MTRGGIHEIIKGLFKNTGARLRYDGPKFVATAELVEQVSTHWLRHTAGSHMANSDIDLCHVRDTLGHESMRTTNTYLHSSDTARHVEIELKHKAKW
jgi:integrase/recombinase XerD